MADGSPIEWTDATWNPITGCSVVSPGCTNCYAMGLAGTRLKHHPSRAGLTRETKAGPVWTGEVRLNEQWLTQPLSWRKPRMIFVCAHGDLFHESVPDEWIDRVFAVMALAPQHTFQVLTKRSARMRAYLSERDARQRGRQEAVNVAAMNMIMEGLIPPCKSVPWPLPNVWLGVSAEDQRRADERIPDLLATLAAVRFVSAEPLLGPIDFNRIDVATWLDSYAKAPRERSEHDPDMRWPLLAPFEHMASGYTSPGLDWVIVGGESGAGARPMHPDWARSIRDQCAAAGVPFFFKQWGTWAAIDQSGAADEAGWQGRGDWMILDKDGDLDIPDERWPDEDAGECAVINVGKARAGRLLDGTEHNGMPVRP